MNKGHGDDTRPPLVAWCLPDQDNEMEQNYGPWYGCTPTISKKSHAWLRPLGSTAIHSSSTGRSSCWRLSFLAYFCLQLSFFFEKSSPQ